MALLDPVALLDGPRGRRMCFEFVLSSYDRETVDGDRLGQAIFYAAYDLDPGRGSSRVLFGFGSEQQSPPKPTPQDVADLLQSVPLAPPDDRRILLDLAAAVDDARYWGEPDGEDVLIAASELRGPLTRVAAIILGTPHAGWWATPMDASGQWEIAYAESTSPGLAPPRAASSRLENWRTGLIEEECVAGRDRPSDPAALWSGAWWSRPPAALTATTRSLGEFGPVGLSLVEDRGVTPTSATAKRIQIPRGARIYEIDGPEAWARLCRGYPMEVTASRRHDWYHTTGRRGRWVIPDWAQVAHDIDAVHLSVSGYLTTAGLPIPVDDERASVLAGWDPDRTYWLIDVRSEAATHQAWAYDDVDETWALSPR